MNNFMEINKNAVETITARNSIVAWALDSESRRLGLELGEERPSCVR